MPDTEPADTPSRVNVNKPGKAEMRRAIKHLKNGTAEGPDGIPPKAIKADLNTSTEMLYELCGKIWETNELPDDWREGYLIKLSKKGDLGNARTGEALYAAINFRKSAEQNKS